METCQRCGKKTWVTTMSYFNCQIICPACEDKEQQHPDYALAKAMEHDAVRAGNFNFPGIGKPRNL